MKNLKRFPSLLGIAFVIASFNVIVLGQANENQIATLNSSGAGVRFDVAVPHASVTLTVIGPDNYSFSKEFKSGNAAEFRLIQEKGERLPDGQYTYELRVTPNFSKETKEALKSAREKGNESEVLRDLRKSGAIPSQPTVQSGGFAVLNGSVILPGATEGAQARATVARPEPQTTAAVYKSRTGYKIQRNHPALMMFDFVIADDLIVQGSGCFGLDCVDGENFGFDTIRVKENNTRIQFDDTSTSAGFPNNNWQIRANDSGSGGTNFLGFVDQGATGNSETGTIVFAVNSGASANSIRVGSNSKVGLRTATPVLDMHANTTDTPAIRLEQNNTGGFTAQTWDVAGNEANFFVRDVTAGSRLPFRIRPGAPTSSIDIAASGNVGLNNASPATALDVSGNALTLGSDLGATTRTTATTKVSRLVMPPFTTGNLSFAYAAGGVDGTNNIAAVGGASAGFSAATVVVFHTAANTNTDTGTERMRITSIGRVGIGTTAPDQLLSVNGDASKSGGGSWQTFSDERLKRIRGPFTTGLNAVMQLQPLRYEYKPNNAMGLASVGERIGFGAQAVQKVIPEAVTQNASGYLMVNNDPIIWTMLNAIKEQQKEIVELKRQIRQLRATHRRHR
jgi:endosialidase-like protein